MTRLDASRAWRLGLLIAGLLGAVATAQDAPTLDAHRDRLNTAMQAYDRAQQIRAEQPRRATELFLSAAQTLEQLSAEGIVNGQLEYNLGNAYLRADDVGRAILHYGRAQRLIPRDPLLADNLATARKRCLTTIQPTRRRDVLRNVFFWHYDTSFAGRATVGIVSYLGLWTLLTLANFVPRRAVTGAALLCGFLSLTLGASLAVERWADRNAPQGVVLEMDVAVHKGPGDTYQRQFAQPLQPGVEFTRRQSRAGWWDIELPDGQSGWIDAENAALIPLN